MKPSQAFLETKKREEEKQFKTTKAESPDRQRRIREENVPVWLTNDEGRFNDRRKTESIRDS